MATEGCFLSHAIRPVFLFLLNPAAEGDVKLLEQGLHTACRMLESQPAVASALVAEGGLAYFASFYRRRFPEVWLETEYKCRQVNGSTIKIIPTLPYNLLFVVMQAILVNVGRLLRACSSNLPPDIVATV